MVKMVPALIYVVGRSEQRICGETACRCSGVLYFCGRRSAAWLRDMDAALRWRVVPTIVVFLFSCRII